MKSRPRGRGAILAATFAASIRAFGGQDGPAVRESVSVRVMDVDVVVTDKAGRPVSNVPREDFSILVDRKPVEIDYFAAFRAGDIRPPDAETLSPDLVLKTESRGRETAVPRHFLLYVDEASIAPAHRRAAIEALRELIGRLNPSDEAAIVAERAAPTTIADWTSRKEPLLAALETISRTSVAGLRRIERERQALREMDLTGIADARESRARLYEEETWEETRKTLRDMTDALALLGDKAGKKVFVDVSEGFELHPGAAMLGAASSAPASALSFRRDASDDLRRFIDRANALEATVFALDVRGLLGPGRDAANDAPLAAMSLAAREDREEGLVRLCEETGGEALLRSHDLAAAVDAVYRDVSFYYSLGVNLRNVSPETIHRVEVQVARPGLVVRARKTYATVTEEERRESRARATLLTGTSFADLVPTLRAGAPVKEHGVFLLPVEVEVAARDLFFTAENGGETARPLYYFAAVSDRGEQTPLSRSTRAFTLPAAESQSVKPLVERVTLKLRKGTYRIVVNVVDPETGRMGTGRLTVRVE